MIRSRLGQRELCVQDFQLGGDAVLVPDLPDPQTPLRLFYGPALRDDLLPGLLYGQHRSPDLQSYSVLQEPPAILRLLKVYFRLADQRLGAPAVEHRDLDRYAGHPAVRNVLTVEPEFVQLPLELIRIREVRGQLRVPPGDGDRVFLHPDLKVHLLELGATIPSDPLGLLQPLRGSLGRLLELAPRRDLPVQVQPDRDLEPLDGEFLTVYGLDQHWTEVRRVYLRAQQIVLRGRALRVELLHLIQVRIRQIHCDFGCVHSLRRQQRAVEGAFHAKDEFLLRARYVLPGQLGEQVRHLERGTDPSALVQWLIKVDPRLEDVWGPELHSPSILHRIAQTVLVFYREDRARARPVSGVHRVYTEHGQRAGLRRHDPRVRSPEFSLRHRELEIPL